MSIYKDGARFICYHNGQRYTNPHGQDEGVVRKDDVAKTFEARSATAVTSVDGNDLILTFDPITDPGELAWLSRHKTYAYIARFQKRRHNSLNYKEQQYDETGAPTGVDDIKIHKITDNRAKELEMGSIPPIQESSSVYDWHGQLMTLEDYKRGSVRIIGGYTIIQNIGSYPFSTSYEATRDFWKIILTLTYNDFNVIMNSEYIIR